MSVIEGVKLFELSSPTEMTAQLAQSILTLFVDSVIPLHAFEPRLSNASLGQLCWIGGLF